MKADEIKRQLEELRSLISRGEDKALNFNQVADYLGLSHSYLYKLTSRKIIPCHRPTGKMLYFSKRELDEWLFNREDVSRVQAQADKEDSKKHSG
jgi:excisionase family DNA binding protein